jgi:hypothetical protein
VVPCRKLLQSPLLLNLFVYLCHCFVINRVLKKLFVTGNYRPISITCIASKLLEHIFASNMMQHLETNNILYELQHGFRAKRSCGSQIISLIHLFERKDLTQFMICSDMPKYFILYSSLLCGTLSKAFAKSIIIKSVCLFLSLFCINTKRLPQAPRRSRSCY